MSGGLTLMISQYLCQRGLSQQVAGNMSASETIIREYPAATLGSVVLSSPLTHTLTCTHKHSKNTLSNDWKSPSVIWARFLLFFFM